jgi:uncharacterized protein YceK
MARVLLIGVSLLAPLLGGCATIYNVSSAKESKVFGGVEIDAMLISSGAGHALGLIPENWWDYPNRAGAVLFGTAALFDIPLSLAGDTVTLPFTALAAWNRLLETPRSQPQQPEEEGLKFWLNDQQPVASPIP